MPACAATLLCSIAPACTHAAYPRRCATARALSSRSPRTRATYIAPPHGSLPRHHPLGHCVSSATTILALGVTLPILSDAP